MENVKNDTLITISAPEKNTTVQSVTLHAPLMIQKGKIGVYRMAARALLDTLSSDYNNVGIDSLMAALLLETVGDENYGKNNS